MRKRHSVFLALFLVVIACGKSSSTDQSVLDDPKVKEAIEEIARKQAQGLAGASARVHRAYNYTSGHSWVKPERNMKIVAVDVEFQGTSEDFDLEDVDVVDGTTNENYGSNPDIFLLSSNGSFQSFDWPDALGGPSIRVLLLYAVPKSTHAIKLSYWQQEIVAQPVELAPIGPAMPSPE